MRRQTARPLRACAVLLTLYVGGRVSLGAMYPDLNILGLQSPPLPAPSLPLDVARAAVTPVRRAAQAVAQLVERGPAAVIPVAEARPRYQVSVELPPPSAGHRRPIAATAVPAAVVMPPDQVATPATMAVVNARTQETPTAVFVPVAAASQLPPGTAAPIPPVRSRGSGLSGSAWLLVREGSGAAPLATAGTLGGSQLGARVNWRPGASPVFLTVRASAALAQRDSEIAPGIGIQGRAGGIILEQRFRLERGRGSAPALVVFGGFSDKPLVAQIKADGYAQAGVVGVNDPALFVDGAVRVERTARLADRLALGIGGGVWGAAQPGASRLDAGPQLVLHLPVGPRTARLSAEYRVRLAGTARPGSGLVITAGTNF